MGGVLGESSGRHVQAVAEVGHMHEFVVSQLSSLQRFSFIILLLTAANAVWLGVHRGSRGCGCEDTQTKVSILVPARNEEHSIARCVESLCTQSYRNIEVVVLNDSSTDSTGAILSRLTAIYTQLKVVQGAQLPAGWAGKNWACHQLAREATGDILLFTDADTWHHRDTVAECVSDMIGHGLGMRTGLVAQVMETWGERLSVPIMNWSTLTFFPSWLVPALHIPGLAFAHGQFMAFTRQAYTACGGHESVRASVLDDMGLANKIQAARIPWAYRDLCARVKCRMYTSFGQAWQGFGKNLFAVFGFRLIPYLLIWTCLMAALVLPPLAALHPDPSISHVARQTSIVLLLQFATVMHTSRVPIWLALMYPVYGVLWWLMAMNSMVALVTGRAKWKGRQLAHSRLRLL